MSINRLDLEVFNETYKEPLTLPGLRLRVRIGLGQYTKKMKDHPLRDTICLSEKNHLTVWPGATWQEVYLADEKKDGKTRRFAFIVKRLVSACLYSAGLIAQEVNRADLVAFKKTHCQQLTLPELRSRGRIALRQCTQHITAPASRLGWPGRIWKEAYGQVHSPSPHLLRVEDLRRQSNHKDMANALAEKDEGCEETQ